MPVTSAAYRSGILSGMLVVPKTWPAPRLRAALRLCFLALLLGPGLARAGVPDEWWSMPLPDDLHGIVVKDVQTQLVNLDCYTGPIDGIAGGGTMTAIRLWQRANGYPETGIISEPLVTVLLTQAPWDLVGCRR